MKLRYVVAAPLLLLIIAGFSPQPCCADPENVRIGLITDTHTTRERTGDEPLYEGHLEEVISSINQADVEVVLAAGDLTQDGTTQQMSDFQQQIKAFVRPVYVVPGNHDVGQKHNSGKQGEVTEDRVALYEQNFGLSYWSRSVSGIRIIGLNSSLLGSGLPEEGDQWAFLENALAPSETQPTLIVMHYPLYLVSADEPGGTYWNVEPIPRARLLNLIKQNGHVLAVLTGHLHRLLVNTTPEGTLLYSSPPVSFGLPKGKQQEGWTLVTIDLTSDKVTTQFLPIPYLPINETSSIPPERDQD